MCNPKPGTRCPSHANAKLTQVQNDLNEAFHSFRENTNASAEQRRESIQKIQRLQQKSEEALMEYRVALAGNTADQHQNTLRDDLTLEAANLGMNEEQADDYMRLNVSMYSGIAAARKGAVADINTRAHRMAEADTNDYTRLSDEMLDSMIEKTDAERSAANDLVHAINEQQPQMQERYKAALAEKEGYRINAQKEKYRRASLTPQHRERMEASPYARYADYTPQQYSEAVTDMLNAKFGQPDAHGRRQIYTVERGRRYDKIVHASQWGDREPSGRGVYMFVDRESGAFLKAASWRAPAQGVRYQPSDGTDAARAIMDHADQFGGWLYAR